MTENRYVFDPSISHFTDTKTGKEYCEYNLDKVVDILNKQEESIQSLKETIILITRAYQLKHNDTIVNLVHGD